MEKGKIIIRKSKKGRWVFEVDLGGKQSMTIPTFFDLKDDYLNGKDCEVKREKGQIMEILVDGKKLPRKANISNERKQTTNQPTSQYQRGQNPSRDMNAKNLFSIDNTEIPQDTRKILENNESEIDNFSLKLNKTVNFIVEKAVLYKAPYKNRKNNDRWEEFYVPFEMQKYASLIEALKNRLDKSMATMTFRELCFAPDWRMIVGIGNESVYETSMTLHHVYGFPYIGGQAIKGVTRSWMIAEIFQNKEEDALKNKIFCLLFGAPKYINKDQKTATGEHQGSVIFFDSFPIEKPTIEVDIMNPHYGDYYQKKTWPVDSLNPNPIPFLTVGHETKFKFYVGIKDKDNKKLSEFGNQEFIKQQGLREDSTLLDVAFLWLKKALTEHGLGAKTAAGYGYFKG